MLILLFRHVRASIESLITLTLTVLLTSLSSEHSTVNSSTALPSFDLEMMEDRTSTGLLISSAAVGDVGDLQLFYIESTFLFLTD